MSYAPDYTPSNSFADDETHNVAGRSTVKTDELDAQLADISDAHNALNSNVKKIQRDDDKLRDFLVEPYALSEQTRAMMVVGGKLVMGEWKPNTIYLIGMLVQRNAIAYVCQTTHNSGPTFNLGFWIAISGDGQAAAYAEQASNSAAAAISAASAAGASQLTASAAAASALISQTSAAASALAAQNAADSIAGLAPVNLSAYMLGYLANNTAAGARASLAAVGSAEMVNSTLTPKFARLEAGGNAAAFSTATFYADHTITGHAWYDFVANSTINWAGGAPIYGHATFNSNPKFEGAVNSDHHHDFQAYPHYNNTGTIDRMSGFFMQPEVTAGTVLSLAQFRAENALKPGGVINNQFGFYCANLTSGAGNYAFYAAGTTKSHLGGGAQFGVPETPAFVGYNATTGHLDLIPRTGGYKNFSRGPLIIGAGPTTIEADSALIDSNVATGHLTITPRTGFGAIVRCANLLLGPTAGFEAAFSNTAGGNLEITPRSTYRMKVNSAIEATGPVVLASFTVATVPSASAFARGEIYVSNEAGGAVTAFSDGTNWRRSTDRAIVT